MNAAQQIHEYLGVHDATVVLRKWRYATSERTMRKGEDGLRRPGRYGKGLRNWITRKQAQARA